MAKIGTAHVEIKPVLNEQALAAIIERTERAVREAVERGLASARAEVPNPADYERFRRSRQPRQDGGGVDL